MFKEIQISPESSSSSDGLSTGAIVGIVLGSVAGVALVVGGTAGFVYQRRVVRRRSNLERADNFPMWGPQSSSPYSISAPIQPLNNTVDIVRSDNSTIINEPNIDTVNIIHSSANVILVETNTQSVDIIQPLTDIVVVEPNMTNDDDGIVALQILLSRYFYIGSKKRLLSRVIKFWKIGSQKRDFYIAW